MDGATRSLDNSLWIKSVGFYEIILYSSSEKLLVSGCRRGYSRAFCPDCNMVC